MNSVRVNRERIQQKRLGESEIALRISRRHTPLVRPEKMNRSERGWPGWRAPGSRREEFLGDASSGQRDAIWRGVVRPGGQHIQPAVGNRSCERIVRGERMQFVLRHRVL
jgi:hypothetical protein